MRTTKENRKAPSHDRQQSIVTIPRYSCRGIYDTASYRTTIGERDILGSLAHDFSRYVTRQLLKFLGKEIGMVTRLESRQFLKHGTDVEHDCWSASNEDAF